MCDTDHYRPSFVGSRARNIYDAASLPQRLTLVAQIIYLMRQHPISVVRAQTSQQFISSMYTPSRALGHVHVTLEHVNSVVE
ncbi:unnamed protein product [Gongylonema pulchrum]|uniref:Uncharacterized protein n=1 Tax=Gongylonema pulchrum TaxID=637853 RepID=A0A183EJV1_9BILA|nr:unnamed protein product [Gongylonema pulchrum]